MDTKPDTVCPIYGCKRSKNVAALEVTLSIKGVDVKIVPCDFHVEMFETMPADLYSVGYTFTNEIEIRLHPAAPAPPA